METSGDFSLPASQSGAVLNDGGNAGFIKRQEAVFFGYFFDKRSVFQNSFIGFEHLGVEFGLYLKNFLEIFIEKIEKRIDVIIADEDNLNVYFNGLGFKAAGGH